MTSELARRALFTIGALLVFRFGTYIPLPGLDRDFVGQLFSTPQSSVFSVASLESAGIISRMAIFTLGIMPYVVAAILVQLATVFFKRLSAMRDGGPIGRAKLMRATLILCLGGALLQAYGITQALEDVPGLVVEPGWLFRLTTVLTFTGGTFFLIWLSRLITKHGIANGVSVLLLAGAVLEVTSAAARLREAYLHFNIDQAMLWAIAIIVVVFVGVIALVETARYQIPVSFLSDSGKVNSVLQLKINNAGIVPAAVARALIGIVSIIVAFFAPLFVSDNDLAARLGANLASGHPGYFLVLGLATVGLSFVYCAALLDPDRISAVLTGLKARVVGVDPGEATAGRVDKAVTRAALMGSVYLALIILIPEVLLYLGVPFIVSGTTLLILVCAFLDIAAHVRGFAGARMGNRGR
jgi:preprotein translocase subunit SecY